MLSAVLLESVPYDSSKCLVAIFCMFSSRSSPFWEVDMSKMVDFSEGLVRNLPEIFDVNDFLTFLGVSSILHAKDVPLGDRMIAFWEILAEVGRVSHFWVMKSSHGKRFFEKLCGFWIILLFFCIFQKKFELPRSQHGWGWADFLILVLICILRLPRPPKVLFKNPLYLLKMCLGPFPQA